MLMLTTLTRVELRRAELVNVVEPTRDGAVAEQHDPVGDADRDDFGVWRATEGLQSRNCRTGQNAERSAAVTEIVENARRPVGGVLRPVRVNEIASEVGAKIFGDRFVFGVVAGVEMCDPDALAGAAACRHPNRIELAVLAVAEPIIVVLVAGVAVADVLRLRPSGPHSEIAVRSGACTVGPLLLQVRFGERDSVVLREDGVAVIQASPSSSFAEAVASRQTPPLAATPRPGLTPTL